MAPKRFFSDAQAIPEDLLLKHILASIRDGVFVIDAQQRFDFCNPAMGKILGCAPEQLIGKNVYEFLHPDDRALAVERFGLRLRGEAPSETVHYRLRCEDTGLYEPMEIRLGEIDLGGNRRGLVGTVTDARELEAYVTRLQTSERDLRQIIDNMADTFYRTDVEGRITMVSPSVTQLLGYQPEELYGELLSGRYRYPEDRMAVLQALSKGPAQARTVEAQMIHKDGSIVWVATKAFYRVDDTGKVIGVEGIARNITEQKRLESDLEQAAVTDKLTGLLNRAGLIGRMEQRIAGRSANRELVVLFIDVDNLKVTNDRLGHAAGDQLLIAAAGRLQGATRPEDLVSRIGGDEFVVVFERDATGHASDSRIETIRRLLNADYREGGGLSASVGVAVCPQDGDTVDALLNLSDERMYVEKKLSKASRSGAALRPS